MKRDLLLGIDIGTSACKLVLFAPDGSAVSSRTESYDTFYPQNGYVEQDPEDWWAAVCRALRSMFDSGVSSDEIAGIGIDGQSWSAIAVDAEGRVLLNDPIWMDTRAENICKRLNSELGQDNIFSLCGNPLKAQYTTGKVLWMKEAAPEAYAKTCKILQSNSFIAYRLTGNITQDLSQCYGLHCFDMRNGRYDDEMCKALGIERRLLPDISPCHEVIGHVSRQAAALTGLSEGTPVVAGGLDAACSTLGAGVLQSGDTQEQGGQAGGMSICIDRYSADPRLILSYHVVPGRWLLQGGTTGGGGALRWFERELGSSERLQAIESGRSSFEFLSELAETSPAGSNGVIFLPYMAGERSPLWDANAKGVFYGLDYSKKRADMVRSLMEGVAYSLRHNLEIAEAAGADVQVLRATGGSANSSVWTQIKSDVTNKRIEVPSSDMATTLGAAIIAGVGVGVYGSFEEAAAKTVSIHGSFTPNKDNFDVYDKAYRKYLALYCQLKDIMNGKECV